MKDNPLQTLLGKLGVSYEELTEEERTTFNSWRKALSGRRITDEDVTQFLDTQYHDAVKKLSSLKLKEREDTFLKMKVDFIIQLKGFLELPTKEKEMIERQINTHN